MYKKINRIIYQIGNYFWHILSWTAVALRIQYLSVFLILAVLYSSSLPQIHDYSVVHPLKQFNFTIKL